MSNLQKIFFGAAIAFLVSGMLIIIPIEDSYKFIAVIGLIVISVLIYDKGYLFKPYRYEPPTNTKESDIDHLRWIYNRLKHIHSENPQYDYMLRLKKIIDNYGNR